jgi:hypothetical protein
MSNRPLPVRIASAVARGLLGVLLVTASGCGGNSPAAPTRTPVPAAPAVAPVAALYTLTASPTTVTPGGTFTVSWTAPAKGSGDWIALFRVTDPNTKYGWHQSTEGAQSGTSSLTAPTEVGQYEFRYLVDDSYVDAVHSNVVTVDIPR